MASKTYRAASTTNAQASADLSESDQTAASRTDGWTVAKNSSGLSADFLAGTKQASGAFTSDTTTSKPEGFTTGRAFRSPAPISGSFAAAAWTLTFAVRAGTASSQAGFIKCRIYASVNADGTSARELTSGAVTGTTSSALSTTADVTSVVTWTPGSAVVLNNEYLFFVIAWRISTASGSNQGDVLIRTGTSTTGTRLVTSNLSPFIAPDTGISSTTTVSGAVQRKQITPAAINATSTVSGGVTVPVPLARRSDVQTAIDSSLTNPSIVLNKPAGTVQGDLLVAIMECGDQIATGISAPDGSWTQQFQLISTVGGGQILTVFTKTAGASEPSSYTFSVVNGNTTGNNEGWVAAMLCYTGQYSPTPGLVASGDAATGPTFTTPSITPVVDKVAVLSFFGLDQSAGTAPSFSGATASSGNSVTKLVDIIESGSQNILGVFEEIQTTQTATAHTATYSGGGTSTRGASTGIFSVRPGVSTGPKPISPAAINSTTTVSANVIALRRLAPAAVNAVTTVTASVRALRRIAPAQVNSTTTITGNVAAQKRITPAQINSVTTVSGAVIALRRIFPAQINAVSTVSGSVRALRRITPAQINATSTVTGTLFHARPITPAQINSTTAVSGTVGRPRVIAPAAINSVTTVSVTRVGVLRRIAPAQINSVSTVTGTVIALRRIAPAQINAVSTVSGTVTARRAITPAVISATSTVTGRITGPKRILPAQINATSTVSGGLAGLRKILPTQISATSVVTGSVAKRFRIVPAQITSTSVVSGAVATRPVVSITGGVVNSTTTVSGRVAALRRISAAVISSSTSVSGALRRLRPILPAQITSTTTISAQVVRTRPVIGAVSSVTTVTGRLVMGRVIFGQIASTTTVTAGLARAYTIAGVISSTSTVSGTLQFVGHRQAGTTPMLLEVGLGAPRLLATQEQLNNEILSTKEDSGAIRSA